MDVRLLTNSTTTSTLQTELFTYMSNLPTTRRDGSTLPHLWRESVLAIYSFHTTRTSFHKQKLLSTLESYTVRQLQWLIDNPTYSVTLQEDLEGFAIFSGIFHTAWISFFEQHLPNNCVSSLLVKIIKIILQAVADWWISRNNTLHTKDKQTTETRDRFQHQIRILHSCRDSVLEQDRQIFTIPVQDLLQKSTSYLKMFIQHYKPIIKQSIRLQQDETKRQHRDIST